MSSSQKEQGKIHGTKESLAKSVEDKASSLQDTDESKPKKPRVLTSDVWRYFSKVVVDGVVKAQCNGCQRPLTTGGDKGTSHLGRHVKNCKHLDGYDKEGKLQCRKLNHKYVRKLIARCVIEHDLPYSFVEYKCVKELLATLNPNVRLVSRKTLTCDVHKIYMQQKAELKTKLQKSVGRICLTSDCWTAVTSEGYICLTAHFVDETWTLNSKILAFCRMEPPHSGFQLAKKVYDCLKDWGIEKKNIFNYSR